MKNFINGVFTTLIIAIFIFAATQYRQLLAVFAPKPTPTPIALPTEIPTPTPEPILPIVRKPAIYLYPQKFMPVSVKLDIKGTLTASIPKYPKNGWYVIATPNGLIDNKYSYLFYEAQLDNYKIPETGWVVATTDLKTWFDKNLPKFGLNKKESTEFKKYWLKILNDTGYYEIKLFSDEFLGKNMDLIVNPTPDTIIRVEFYFKHLTEPTTLVEPEIVTPKRSGFTVVEWGGTIGK